MSDNQSFLKAKALDWFRDFTSLGNPLILLLVPLLFLGFSGYYKLLLLALLLNEIFCSLIKILFHKKRPDGQEFSGPLQKLDAGSFPSIHASRIMTTYLFLFLTADLSWQKALFISIILIVGLSRILLKRHYPSDVLGGWIIGALIALVFFYQVNSILLFF